MVKYSQQLLSCSTLWYFTDTRALAGDRLRKKERERGERSGNPLTGQSQESFIHCRLSGLHPHPLLHVAVRSSRCNFHLTVAQTAQSSVQLVIRSHYKGRTSSTYKFRATDTLKTISTEITLTKDWD